MQIPAHIFHWHNRERHRINPNHTNIDTAKKKNNDTLSILVLKIAIQILNVAYTTMLWIPFIELHIIMYNATGASCKPLPTYTLWFISERFVYSLLAYHIWVSCCAVSLLYIFNFIHNSIKIRNRTAYKIICRWFYVFQTLKQRGIVLQMRRLTKTCHHTQFTLTLFIMLWMLSVTDVSDTSATFRLQGPVQNMIG